jgi:hypothetical protein
MARRTAGDRSRVNQSLPPRGYHVMGAAHAHARTLVNERMSQPGRARYFILLLRSSDDRRHGDPVSPLQPPRSSVVERR